MMWMVVGFTMVVLSLLWLGYGIARAAARPYPQQPARRSSEDV